MFQMPPLADTIWMSELGKDIAILGVTSTEEPHKIVQTGQLDEKVPCGERNKGHPSELSIKVETARRRRPTNQRLKTPPLWGNLGTL